MNILNGIDEARRRIEEQERTAMQYTRMSNAAAVDQPSMPREHAVLPPSAGKKSAAEEIHTDQNEDVSGKVPDSGLSMRSGPLGRIAEVLGTDSEKLLILSLLVLLGSEGADIALLAALAYLLI